MMSKWSSFRLVVKGLSAQLTSFSLETDSRLGSYLNPQRYLSSACNGANLTTHTVDPIDGIFVRKVKEVSGMTSKGVINHPFAYEKPLELDNVDRDLNTKNLKAYLEYLNLKYNRPSIEQIESLQTTLDEIGSRLGADEIYSVSVHGGYFSSNSHGSHAELLIKGNIPICVWFGSRIAERSQDMELEGTKRGCYVYDFLQYVIATSNNPELRIDYGNYLVVAGNLKPIPVRMHISAADVVGVLKGTKNVKWSKFINLVDLRKRVACSTCLVIGHLPGKYNFISDAFNHAALWEHSDTQPIGYQRIDFCDPPPLSYLTRA